eukprot:m.754988 g.754988  ORF g.754988 m.754988 type:complete len:449 (-) comp23179_c0_seq7:327-1673(-)
MSPASRSATVTIAVTALCTLAHAIDNGVGITPPMGWRSWNCFHGNVNQQIITGQIDALAAKQASGQSLLDIGYARIGLDDNWQKCGAGINNSFHDSNGHPIIDKSKFPDMRAMNDHAHALGVRTGWYFNNCICHENGLIKNWLPQMKGDTSAIHDLGWDGVKIDGCGPSHNLQEWADLLNATGGTIWKDEGYMIENCHDNTSGSGGQPGTPAHPGFPYWENGIEGGTLHCPMNFWRVSGDINSAWESVMGNLQHTTPFQNASHPIAQPGCWAYPDMLEVGRMKNYSENAAHFYAWCIVSAPLVLGFDLTDNATLASVWDIITNAEALNVSQTWAGHPGRLVKSATEQCTTCDMSKMSAPAPRTLTAGFDATGGLPSWQVWAKHLGGNRQAALLLNLEGAPQTVSISTADLGLQGAATVRDIGAHKDLGSLTIISKELQGHEALFVTLN